MTLTAEQLRERAEVIWIIGDLHVNHGDLGFGAKLVGKCFELRKEADRLERESAPSAPCSKCEGRGEVKWRHTFGKGWEWETCSDCAGSGKRASAAQTGAGEGGDGREVPDDDAITGSTASEAQNKSSAGIPGSARNFGAGVETGPSPLSPEPKRDVGECADSWHYESSVFVAKCPTCAKDWLHLSPAPAAGAGDGARADDADDSTKQACENCRAVFDLAAMSSTEDGVWLCQDCAAHCFGPTPVPQAEVDALFPAPTEPSPERREPPPLTRIMYVCVGCHDALPESCGYWDRHDLAVMPDGRWLCQSCAEEFEGEERVTWADLPSPPIYVPQTEATPPSPPAPAIEGQYRIVPLFPTGDMIEAGHNAHRNTYGVGVVPCVVHYRQMLAASPTPADLTIVSKGEVERLRLALAFYAKPDNWNQRDHYSTPNQEFPAWTENSAAQQDRGAIAIRALHQPEQQEK